MRILVARCEIAYHGRATTRLGAGDRVILFKDDGSLCVHAERGYKPLNYMPGPTSVSEDGDVIRVHRAASGETLLIVVHEVHSDAVHDLVDDAVLQREDAELQIHRLLERAPEVIEAGLVVLRRERFTDVGPVDLFCRDAAGRTVVVEEVHEDARHELEDDAVLEREDAELQIHRLLERAPETIEAGLVVLQRERPTDTGPIDLFCRDPEGRTVVVEVKRTRAVAAHVEQLTRYCERVDLDPAHSPCRGILVAPEIAPQAQVMCEARGFAFVALDFDVLKGEVAPELTLFE